MAVTLKDVAKIAGVSVKTVSNVVNGYGFVRPDNRRRVEEALSATGYRPHIGARNLRRGRTGFIALMVPDLGIPYFGELAGLIITAARGNDWNVLIEQTQGVRKLERAAISSMGPHLVDGAILSPESLEADDFAELSQDLPVVMLGEHMVEVAIDRVAIDNITAARVATDHLIELGRRRIAAIGQNPRRGTAALRLAGYHAALQAAGLDAPDELIAPAAWYHRPDGAAAMRALLDLDHPPDGVFCFNDLLAMGALRAIVDRGLRVPEDIAIVGFDGSEESAYSLPSLTTIAPDKEAIAVNAVKLISRDRSEPYGVQEQRTPFTLELRESTLGRVVGH